MPIYALKNLFLGHNTAIRYFLVELYVNLAIYRSILAKIGLFLENRQYLGFFLTHFMCARAPRAQDISANIDPTDLKFLEVIL